MVNKILRLSIVTVGELLYGALNKKELNSIKNDLQHLQIIHLTKETGAYFSDLMISYSLSHRINLPDGIIAATALTENIQLYTHNLKDFRYIKGLSLFEEM